MTESLYVHALALGLDSAWRRQGRDERCRSAEEFCAADREAVRVGTWTISLSAVRSTCTPSPLAWILLGGARVAMSAVARRRNSAPP